MVYTTFLLIMAIHPTRKAWLLAKKVKILAKYLDFANIFSKQKVLVLPKLTKLN